jgi:hypothetical protein
MPGKVLLIVDGHTSHTNNLEMLEFSEEKIFILLCLPPHTTHYLQPLDRCFFKSLKTFYYDACRRFIKGNTGRKLKRVNFGKLLGESWNRAATVENAVSAFRATRIVPFNPQAIPDYAFIANISNRTEEPTITEDQTNNESQRQETDQENILVEAETLGKMLEIISPTPSTSVLNVRKRGGNIATVLTSEEN